jgi:HlyD family secretion protein
VAAASVGNTKPEENAVACLGRIEPQDDVLSLTPPYFEGRPQRVLELKVKENDQVHAGQLLAILDGKGQLETSLRRAEARADLARARLARVKSGAKQSDISAQRAEVAQLETRLENARTEYQRYERLRQTTDVSSSDLDARQLAVQTTERQLEGAQDRLKSILEVPQADVDVAESELRVALSEVAHARTELNSSAVVNAPANGRILRIYAYPGAEAGTRGLLDLGKTDSMYVVAEVYETDIGRVHLGQRATVTSDLFPGSISGDVETVGTTIAKADVLPLDPVAFADARIFRVYVHLQDGDRVSGFINGKVNVVIRP